jgi:hypothetical protein
MARQVLAVDDGRAAVNFEDTAALAAVCNPRARTTMMVLTEKAIADSDRAPADFTCRKTRDTTLGWDRAVAGTVTPATAAGRRTPTAAAERRTSPTGRR